MIHFLLWIGIIRRIKYGDKKGKILWPFSIWPRHMWWYIIRHQPPLAFFRNASHVIKWVPGRLLPRRWGFRFLIFEFGDRGG